jgi:hypothetical protein
MISGTPAGNANECLEVFFCEPAGVYTGDTYTDVATFSSGGAKVTFGTSTTLTAANVGLVKDGEWVLARFNHQGGYYKCQKDTGANTFTFLSNTPPPIVSNDPTLSVKLPFEVILPPRKSAAAPLDVPAGLAIDLSSSGIGTTKTQFIAGSTSDTTPVVVMFSPNGDVSDIYYGGAAGSDYGTIHFLIGQNDNSSSASGTVPTPALADLTSFWVSIGVRTGSITTAENNWNPSWGSSPASGYMSTCRQFATSVQTKGGG